MLAGRTIARVALVVAGAACGSFGSSAEDAGAGGDAATQTTDGPSVGVDATPEGGPTEAGADAGGCTATGRAAVDTAYGQAAAFPFPVRRGAVTPTGDVYGVAQRACPDGGNGATLARIGRDGVASGALVCLEGENAWAISADRGDALVGTSLGTTSPRVRLWRVSPAGTATRLDDFTNTAVSPPDPTFRTPYPTLVFASGSLTAWGGFLEAQVGSPRLKGVLRASTGGAWFPVTTPVTTEVPVAMAARGSTLLVAFVNAEGENYLALRRFNVASTLSEDTTFSAKVALPQPVTVTPDGPVRSLVWHGDTITLVAPGSGTDSAIIVFRGASATTPAAFAASDPRVAGACDGAVLIAATGTGGAIDLLRFASGSLGWSGGAAPPHLPGLGLLAGLGVADDGLAYVIGSQRAARLTP